MPQSNELTEWLKTRQSELKVTKTTTTPGGQTLDWVPIESQSQDKIATPPPATAPVAAPDPKKPAKGASFDIGVAGPEGHVPILRPDLSKVKETIDLKQYLSKRGGLRVNRIGIAPTRNPLTPIPPDIFTAQAVKMPRFLAATPGTTSGIPRSTFPPRRATIIRSRKLGCRITRNRCFSPLKPGGRSIIV
jgi:hypothetical protein